jgi:hypothetical protein
MEALFSREKHAPMLGSLLVLRLQGTISPPGQEPLFEALVTLPDKFASEIHPTLSIHLSTEPQQSPPCSPHRSTHEAAQNCAGVESQPIGATGAIRARSFLV